MSISRFEIINSAIMEIGINYDDANYLVDPIYKVVNGLFDQIITDAMANSSFQTTKLITNLNRDFSDPVTYRGVTLYPYQVPVDSLYIVGIEPKVEFKVMRGKIYIAKEKDVKMIHCSKTQLSSINVTMRQYLIYFLAFKICKPLNKSFMGEELFNKMLYFKDKVKMAEMEDLQDNWGEDDESFDIY